VRQKERGFIHFFTEAVSLVDFGGARQQQEAYLSLSVVDDGIVGRIHPSQQQIREELQRVIPPQE
jgi:hypothetical protein